MLQSSHGEVLVARFTGGDGRGAYGDLFGVSR